MKDALGTSPHAGIVGADDSVCAVVVTRDRRELLRRCLEALAGQERAPEEVLVVDNASSDGTAEMVRREFPEVELLRLEENVGGAGGFNRGLAWGHARGHGWLWLMDDDTLPEPGALRALLDGAARAPGPAPIVASVVTWKDGRLHPMNRPVLRWRRPGALAEGVGHGLLLIRYGTFVSLAVRREAIDRYGLPPAHYFIWSDDVEYTARVLRDAPGWLVPESRVVHWTPEPHAAASTSSDRFYFHARNGLLVLRGRSFSPVERLDYGRFWLRSLLHYARASRRDPRRLRLLARALRDGIREPVR